MWGVRRLASTHFARTPYAHTCTPYAHTCTAQKGLPLAHPRRSPGAVWCVCALMPCTYPRACGCTQLRSCPSAGSRLLSRRRGSPPHQQRAATTGNHLQKAATMAWPRGRTSDRCLPACFEGRGRACWQGARGGWLEHPVCK